MASRISKALLAIAFDPRLGPQSCQHDLGGSRPAAKCCPKSTESLYQNSHRLPGFDSDLSSYAEPAVTTVGVFVPKSSVASSTLTRHAADRLSGNNFKLRTFVGSNRCQTWSTVLFLPTVTRSSLEAVSYFADEVEVVPAVKTSFVELMIVPSKSEPLLPSIGISMRWVVSVTV